MTTHTYIELVRDSNNTGINQKQHFRRCYICVNRKLAHTNGMALQSTI